MKRNRRVAKETASANLFITEFKLKASQSTNKEYKHRKMNTTLGNFKQILLQDDARKERQSVNGREKPLLEQLKFKNKEDDFRPPQSITKRSISKMKEESRLKFGNQTNDFFDPNQQQPSLKKELTDKSRAIAQYFVTKPQKPLTQKSVLKQKLEKTALQKFNSVVLKENQQNQNVVSEKCAQVLYIMLKTARMNKHRQGTILKSQPGEQNNQYYEQMIAKNKVNQIQNNYLNQPIFNNAAPNSYFLKEANKKNQYLLLESKSKPNANQNQQQSSFGLNKKPNQTHADQIEQPRKSIYQQFDNSEENFSQQSSLDDLNLNAQSSIPIKKNDVISKTIIKEMQQQKNINGMPKNQVSSKQNKKNTQKQQFKGAVEFNFVPKAPIINQLKNEEKFQQIADKFKVDEKKKSAKINPYDSEKDSKKFAKLQVNIPKKKDQKDLYDLKNQAKIESIVGEQMISLKGKEKISSIVDSVKDNNKKQTNQKDLYDLKNKAKIESIVGEQMISLKGKEKIQSIVDSVKDNDKKQTKFDANVRKNSLKSNDSKKDDKKSNLLSVPSDIQSIPQADVVIRKNDGQKKNQQTSSKNYISLNNNIIQKILTEDNIKKPSQNSKKQIQNNKISLPPPKLSKNTQIKNPINPKIPYNNDIDEDGIQEVNIGIKKQLFPQASNHQKSQPKAIPEKLPPQAQQKIEQKPQKQQVVQKKVPDALQNSQHSSQQQQPDELQDQLCFYIERIEDIGMYRIQSKDCYNDKSIDKQLVQIHKVCAYYLAHQFLYLANSACSLFKSTPFNRQFYTISIDQLNILKQKEIIDEQVLTLQEHLQQSKKLLKKSYDQCKSFLQKKEQILLMDAKISYHIKCCSFVIKQFKKVYELKKKNPKLQTMTKRCAYLINLYCTLRLLNGQQLKQHQTLEEIENLSEYVENYKHFLESQ